MELSAKNRRAQSKKTPLEKLKHRIQREFIKCTYIGDIKINDDEFNMLIEELRKYFDILLKLSQKKDNTSPVIAVALVQIGIRYYDGSFWSHVKNLLGIDSLNGVQQGIIGKCFINTLIKYNKIHVEENELRNNILMHCFITKYYAEDLFDFLFAYYQVDLDRDLARHDKTMRNSLMVSMQKGENSSRAYKIKKHTADAVSANERGCKIRVARILRFIDNALFENTLPTNSPNRIAQLFVDWATNSGKFNREKKHIQGLGKRGKKRYSSPYIHFNTKTEQFELIIPSQHIMLNEDEEMPDISLTVSLNDNETVLRPALIGSVTGCKTEKAVFNIAPRDIFSSVKLSIVKNGTEMVRTFIIKKDSVRFFDDDWEMHPIVDYLPVGTIYVFTEKEKTISSYAILDKEKHMGLNLFTVYLKSGDIIKHPDGKILSAGKPLEEGILPYGIVYGATVSESEVSYNIYSKIPTIYFRMQESKESGTRITINNKPFRLDLLKTEKFENNSSSEKEYLLKLEEYISENGIYKVEIDIPNNRKNHSYSFAFIKDFEYGFENAPYVFKDKGTINFSCPLLIEPVTDAIFKQNNSYEFRMNSENDYISFLTKTQDKKFLININVPAFKWKFDDGEWQIEKPEEIWHKEFPSCIFLKFPSDEVRFSMPPIMLDNIPDDEDISFHTSFFKNKESGVFVCDTRKMLSWFGFEDPIRPLSISFESNEENISFVFANIFTRCFVLDSKIIEDRKKNCLVLKSDIVGLSDCVVDIFFNNEIIAEKQEVTTGGVKLYVPFTTGRYKADFYEWEEDEYDFGFSDYKKIETKVCKYINNQSITGKNVVINNLEKKVGSSIFGPDIYSLSKKYVITDIKESAEGCDCYEGHLITDNAEIWDVLVEIIDNNHKKTAYISFFDSEEDCYMDFLYDKEKKILVKDQDPAISNSLAKKIYDYLDPELWLFNIKID